MSNDLHLEGTIFLMAAPLDPANPKVTASPQWGYRIYADDEDNYDDTWEAAPKPGAFDFLREVLAHDSPRTNEMLQWARSDKHGMYINRQYMTWDQRETDDPASPTLGSLIDEELLRESDEAIPDAAL